MNKPLLIGFILIVIVILGLPLLSNVQPKGEAGSAGEAASAPAVTQASLENSTWSLNTEQGVVTVSLLPGGQVVATPPPGLAQIVKQMSGSDTLAGTWTLNGNKVVATVNAMGKTQTIEAEVVNGMLTYKGQAATRVQ